MSPRPRLSSGDVEAFIKAHSGWKHFESELRKTFEFTSFTDSMKFVNDVAELGEKENHHPDIDIRFKRVHVALVTYDADGITRRDVELADLIDKLYVPKKAAKKGS